MQTVHAYLGLQGCSLLRLLCVEGARGLRLHVLGQQLLVVLQQHRLLQRLGGHLQCLHRQQLLTM